MSNGLYAEHMNYIVEQIYNKDIKEIHKRYRMSMKDNNKREIDLFVILNNGRRLVFEVRDRNRVQGISWIDEIVGKYAFENIDEHWICTFSGCTLSKPAIKKLLFHGIKWREFRFKELILDRNLALIIEGIKPEIESSYFMVDNEKFKNIKFTAVQDGKLLDIDLKADLITNIKWSILAKFSEIKGENKFTIDFTDMLSNCSNHNFSSNPKSITAHIPLTPITYLDYLSEKYSLVNDEKNSVLVASEKGAIYIFDGELLIDFKFVSDLLSDNVIISESFTIITKGLGGFISKSKNIRVINTSDSDIPITLTRIYGVNKKHS